MSSKKKNKNYSISINLKEEIASPHVLDLSSCGGYPEGAKKIDDEYDNENTVGISDVGTGHCPVRAKSNWRCFKIGIRLFWLSLFDRDFIEPRSMRMHPGSAPHRFKELFVVGLFSLAFKGICKILDAFAALFRPYLETERESIEQEEKPKGILPRSLKLREAVAVFIIVAFVVVLPLRLFLTYEGLIGIKEKITDAGEAMLGHISLAARDIEAEGRNEVIQKVEEQLSFASGQINEINFLLRNIISILPEKGEQFKSGDLLLKAGTELTYAATVFNNRFSQFEKAEKISDKFSYIKMGVEDSLPYLVGAENYLNRVEENAFPLEIEGKIKQIKKMISEVISGADEFLRVSEVVLNILGVNEQKRYLLIFQNNNEIRPTGGFIGSFAEIAVYEGEIEKTYFPGGGSYDIDGGLLTRLVPPEPLQLIAGRWYFRDSNWFPDFPSSAKKMMWFYEKSGNGTVDGVITINASFVENLLKIVGPIEMPEYEKVLTAENFIDEVQYAVEIEYDKEENKPKQILADLMPILIERIMKITNENMFEMGGILANALQSRDIQFYFTRDEIEQIVLDVGWGGEIKNTSGDYLAVYNSNIAGQKTDGVINETIEHETRIDKDGSITDTVYVTRTHHGVKGDLFTGVRNVNYARVYVPRGAVLLKAEGFAAPEERFFDTIEDGCVRDEDIDELERLVAIDSKSGTKITEEFGKTVFGNWVMVDPGESITYSLTYRLPFKIEFQKPSFLENLFNEESRPIAPYNFFIQKQSGSDNTSFTHQTYFPENMEGEWGYNKESDILQKLDSDKFFGKLIKFL